MCGIAGFVGEGDKKILRLMVDAIKHRGPDASNFLLREKVGFGHARLSIIDITDSGRQPMEDPQKKVAVIFNGEIYNFFELRESLKKKYRFISMSDTEVILYAYKEYGESCFEKFNGMFAIAIYDFEAGKLLLVRDRMGKKPLYWTLVGETLIFASELTALLKHKLVKREIDFVSLSKYLSYDYIPTPRSLIKNVSKLEPATYLVYQGNKIRKERFWKPTFAEKDISIDEAIEILDKKMAKSVKDRLISDVPLGVFLSGGLDSAVTAYYAALQSPNKIKTFSIGFEEKSFDESLFSNTVAKVLDTDHHLKVFRMKDALEIIPPTLNSLDEPNADPSIIPTSLLSKFARSGITVALGGDGGDELFAGYPMFLIEKYMWLSELVPNAIKKMIIRGVQALPASNKNFGFDFVLKKFGEGWQSSHIVDRHMRWLGSFAHENKEKLLNQELFLKVVADDEYQEAREYFYEHQEMKDLNRLLYMFQRTYMMDEVLAKVDRASMGASLEVRAPFLDYEIVQFVNELPFSYKLHGLTSKYILKKMMKGRLPDTIINRKKKGFGMPIGLWLRKELKDYCNSILSRESIKEGGIFNPVYVERLKQEHFEGKHDHYKKLWNLMAFEVWRKTHMI